MHILDMSLQTAVIHKIFRANRAFWSPLNVLTCTLELRRMTMSVENYLITRCKSTMSDTALENLHTMWENFVNTKIIHEQCYQRYTLKH